MSVEWLLICWQTWMIFMDDQDLLADIMLSMNKTIRTNILQKQREPDLVARIICIVYKILSLCIAIDKILITDHWILSTAYLHLPMPLMALLTNRNYIYIWQKSDALLGETKQSMKGRAEPQQGMLPKIEKAGLLPESSPVVQFCIQVCIYIASGRFSGDPGGFLVIRKVLWGIWWHFGARARFPCHVWVEMLYIDSNGIYGIQLGVLRELQTCCPSFPHGKPPGLWLLYKYEQI